MKMQFTLALRYLAGRKLRTALTTLAIMFGVLVIFGILIDTPLIEQAFQLNVHAAFGQADATITSKTSEAFDAGVADQVAAIDGVQTVSPILNRTVTFSKDYYDHDPLTPDRVTSVNLVGINIDRARTIHSYQVQEGRFLEAGDTNSAVITQNLAAALGLKLGDSIMLPTAIGESQLTIVGILPARATPGNEDVLVTLPTAEELAAMPGKINIIEVNFASVDAADRTRVESEILTTLGDTYQVGALSNNSQFLTSLQLGTTIFALLSALALLMGAFIIFNTFRTVVAERRRDIGMLRTLGASRRTVLGVILAEGLLQGILGTALGMLLGYLAGLALISGLSGLFSQFINTKLGTPVISLGAVILSLVIGLGTTLVASILPAIGASRVTPLEALRPVVGEVSLRRMAGFGFWSGVTMIVVAVLALVTQNVGLISLGGVLFIIGLFLVTPALVNPIAKLLGGLMSLIYARSGTAQLAEGNLSRQPSRAATTASTTLIALAIVVMAASLISSLLLGFGQILRKSLGADFLVLPPSVAAWGSDLGASQNLKQSLSSVGGVGVVSTLRFAPSLVNGTNIELMGIDPVTFPQVSGLVFSASDEQKAYSQLSSGRNVIVNGILASTIGAKVGDSLELLSPSGTQSYRIVAIATDYLDSKLPTATISQDNLAADFGANEDLLYFINARQGADRSALSSGLGAVVADYPQFRLIDGQAYIDENLALFNSFFSGLVGIVLFLAIPSLIAMVNTLAIGVIERTREIGMLRAIGSTRAQVRTIVLTEALILSGIGTVFGVLAGLYLGDMAIGAMGSLGFPTRFVFPTSGIILGLAAGIVFGLIAAIIPARQATKLQIVEALRYE